MATKVKAYSIGQSGSRWARVALLPEFREIARKGEDVEIGVLNGAIYVGKTLPKTAVHVGSRKLVDNGSLYVPLPPVALRAIDAGKGDIVIEKMMGEAVRITKA